MLPLIISIPVLLLYLIFGDRKTAVQIILFFVIIIAWLIGLLIGEPYYIKLFKASERNNYYFAWYFGLTLAGIVWAIWRALRAWNKK